MKKIIYITVLFLSFGMTARLQAQHISLNYQMAAPLGETKDFTKNFSFRGVSLDYQYFLNEKFTVGIGLGWNVFHKSLADATGNFTFGNDDEIYTITGKQFRYTNTVPILIGGRYYFSGENRKIRPYAGIGLGTSWTETRLEVGHFVANKDGWQFAFAPEIGAYIPLCDRFGFNIGAKYNYAVKTSELPAQQNLAISLGITLNAR